MQQDTGRAYHTACTGSALNTAQAHKSDAEITLYGACFCPFVQRVWVALEYFGLPYKYYEVDPYKKPQELLEISPKGLVPAIILHSHQPPRSLNDSTVIMEYLEDLSRQRGGRSLFPPLSDPYARALVRLQADHATRIVSAFYRFLQAQVQADQVKAGREFVETLGGIVPLLERADRESAGVENRSIGLWRENGQLSWTDVLLGPWLFRATNVLKHYRALDMSSHGRVSEWIDRIIQNEHFAATCSEEGLYIDSYERYAFNRPNTSQVADAINSGAALP
jgi:glutathione S-transferase